MSAVAIVLIVLAALVLVLLVGGAIAARRRVDAGDHERHVAEADHALEQARAADKGWDRAVMEEAAREALARERPEWSYERLDLVLVDDRPGVVHDRAHFLAVGSAGETQLILTREAGGQWIVERVE